MGITELTRPRETFAEALADAGFVARNPRSPWSARNEKGEIALCCWQDGTKRIGDGEYAYAFSEEQFEAWKKSAREHDREVDDLVGWKHMKADLAHAFETQAPVRIIYVAPLKPREEGKSAAGNTATKTYRPDLVGRVVAFDAARGSYDVRITSNR